MRNHNLKRRLVATACSAAVVSLSLPAFAQSMNDHSKMNSTASTNAVPHSAAAVYPTSSTTATSMKAGDARDEAKGAAEDIRQAEGVIHKMESNSGAKDLLLQAKGVFIVPKYGRAALGIGARGGVGVLLVRQGNTWSSPAFYNFGGISAGLQAGVEGGSFVLVLNDDKAVKSFRQENNWSLNAGAGLTVIDWSAKGQGSAGKGDITVWSDTKGLFGDLSVSVTDIKFDLDQNAAYYGKQVTASNFADSHVSNHESNQLKSTLAAASGTSTGS